MDHIEHALLILQNEGDFYRAALPKKYRADLFGLVERWYDKIKHHIPAGAVVGITAGSTPSLLTDYVVLWLREVGSDNHAHSMALKNLALLTKRELQAKQDDELLNQLYDNNPPTITVNEDTIMSNKIETKIFVNGVDAATMSDDQLFDVIQKAEADIAKMDGIAAKPKKLAAKINEAHAFIKSLVEYIDAR